ncbi:MAG: hypothetical protein WCP14_00495 [bacterium]
MKKGSILIGILMVLVTLMTLGIALSLAVRTHSKNIQKQYQILSALTYAEAGINKGLWEINKGNLTYGATKTLDTTLTGGEFDVSTEDCGTDCKYIESTGYLPTKAKPQATKTVRVKINGVENVTTLNFNYSAQSNANQISMSNNAVIKGSAYSNGPIYMSNNSSITGNATSAGNSPTTSYISNGKISGNATAFTISGTNVAGTKTTGAYPATQEPPIAPANLESTIDSFEAVATAGGITNGNVTINGTNNTLGPRQINGNLTVTNNSELKITGNLWVNGNITINNNAKVYLDSSFGNNSAVIIADYKSNRSDWTKGIISLSNNVTISGINKNNPKTPSYILMFSTQSPKAPAQPDNWKSYPAINVSNNIHGGVYYAPYGSYKQNNVSQIRAVVANGLVLENNATLDYDGNWGNSGISSGPAGKWTITEWLILE